MLARIICSKGTSTKGTRRDQEGDRQGSMLLTGFSSRHFSDNFNAPVEGLLMGNKTSLKSNFCLAFSIFLGERYLL